MLLKIRIFHLIKNKDFIKHFNHPRSIERGNYLKIIRKWRNHFPEKQIFIGDKYENRIMLPLSLSYDHRVIDGAEGARFCVHLKESLGKDFAYKLAV